MKEVRTVLVVCYANYCRSPVAEVLLKKKFKDILNVKSFGLQPILESNMDKRSYAFLKNLGYSNILHMPKKISKKEIKSADLVLALDFQILNILNIQYKNYSNKFRLLNFQNIKIDLSDPYKYDESKYLNIMNNIKEVCDEIELTF